MIKWVATVKRPPTMTRSELREWWFGRHASMAKGLPGLKKYVISLAVDSWQEQPQYDGIAELWFGSMEDLQKALDSAVFSELRRDLTENGVTVVRIFTEEHVIVDRR
jgi:uncharacterized protein (TIGR02118 family)